MRAVESRSSAPRRCGPLQFVTEKLLAQCRKRVRRVIGTNDSATSNRFDTAFLIGRGLARLPGDGPVRQGKPSGE